MASEALMPAAMFDIGLSETTFERAAARSLIARNRETAIAPETFIEDFGNAVAADPLATRALRRIQETGYQLVMDFGSAPGKGVMGETFGGNIGEVRLFTRENRTMSDLLSTLVHESRHAGRAVRGAPIGVFEDEVMAAKLDFVFKYRRRPTLVEAAKIRFAVKQAYGF